VVACAAVPQVSEPAPALVRVDGQGGFAQLPFARGLPLLVDKARRHGIAAMAITNAVHFAALWPEVEALAGEGLVALAFTPSHAWVAPEGGTRPVFGTNPIAFAWPRPGRAPFVFDFATSAVARGEIELHRRAGKPVPPDWGYDAQGQPSTDAAAVLDGAMRIRRAQGLGARGHGRTDRRAADQGHDQRGIAGRRCRARRLADRRELILAIDPAGFLGAGVEAHLQRAEALFAAIEGQGARLPGTRRLVARARSAQEGLRIPVALHQDILSVLARASAL
jgi:LDH2 family malate/lactate/ureidoglycolate dehydrogenase